MSVVNASPVFAQEDVAAKPYLLNQVLFGEVHFKDDIVAQALSRLVLIAPNDPEVLFDSINLNLRQNKIPAAQNLLRKLKEVAPESDFYKKAQVGIYLASLVGRQRLQQAKVYAVSGRYEDAKTDFDELYKGYPPNIQATIEYWVLVAHIPKDQAVAYQQLEAIFQLLNSRDALGGAESTMALEKSLTQTLTGILVERAKVEIAKEHWDAANLYLLKAHDYAPQNSYVLVKLGDVAFNKKDMALALKRYQMAFAASPDSTTAIHGIISIYKRQSPEKAMAFLNGLTPEMQGKLKDTMTELKGNIVQAEAEKLVARRQFNAALSRYQEALKLTPQDAWLTYSMARLLVAMGKQTQAQDLFLNLQKTKKEDPEFLYAYALFLSNNNQAVKALALLKSLPGAKWTKSMHELSTKIQFEMAFEHAKKLWDLGDKAKARAYLLKLPQTATVKLTLAGWSYDDGQFEEALNDYRRALLLEPANLSAKIGEVKSLIALDRKPEARVFLARIPYTSNMDDLRNIANAWEQVGELNKAMHILISLKDRARRQKPGMASALIFRDAAEVEKELLMPQRALNDYREGMVKSEITTKYPADNETFTTLTRNTPSDDWLKRSIRSNAADLYRQQQTRATLEGDRWRILGTGGTSNQTADDLIFQLDTPWRDGRFFIRADDIKIGAGTFAANNGIYFDQFGTCSTFGCSSDYTQIQRGYNGAMGWENNQFAIDAGFTPEGFPVVNWAGGFMYKSKFKQVRWNLGVTRRPLNNSLLSFAGTTDPVTGTVWGGVMATGPVLSVSYDQGGAHGYWGNYSASNITGENVANNQAVRLLHGYYYKWINEDNRRFSIGLNNMIWFYDKDLSGYSLGQGGYYSPQKYLSFAVPVNYRQRVEKLSYEFGVALAWSRATIGNSYLYPLPQLIPNLPADANSITQGSTSWGIGYTMLASAERRINSHWVIGGVVDIQRARDYTPSHMSLYIRYLVDPWLGDMDMPINAIVPYGSYK